MTITRIHTGEAPVVVDGDTLTIRDLTVVHAEAANFVRSQLAEHGDEVAADLVRRSLPVGLVALSLGTAGMTPVPSPGRSMASPSVSTPGPQQRWPALTRP